MILSKEERDEVKIISQAVLLYTEWRGMRECHVEET
jgi:mRNA-degrading endonuclease YafQ of YafQ-DinJ toxin-antitoxin module